MRNFILGLFAAGSLADAPDYDNQLNFMGWWGNCGTGREQSPIDFKMVTPVTVNENNGLNFSKQAEAWSIDKEEIAFRQHLSN